MKIIIELNRDDLRLEYKDKNISNITIYDFKGSILTREHINEAAVISFIDISGDQKMLKNKWKRFGFLRFPL